MSHKSGHAARLQIDLKAIAANWRLLADKAKGAECAAVVKADGYGCGMAQAAGALEKAGCKTFFVAHLSEGMALRKIAPNAMIYVFNGLVSGSEPLYRDHDLRPILGELSELHEWHVTFANKSPPFALHVDTGMNRLGLEIEDLQELPPGLAPDFIMSHFIASENPNAKSNAEQIAAFKSVRERFPKAKASLANSSGIFLPQQPFFDMVRPGYALYGGNPTPGEQNPMRNVVMLEAPVLQVREVLPGESVGYDATWTAKRKSRVATLSLGYADGFFRSASATNTAPGGLVAWHGETFPVVGRVSMDLITVDVTDARAAPQRGDFVEVIGDRLPIDEVAKGWKTPDGYDVLTSLGRRYMRSYI